MMLEAGRAVAFIIVGLLLIGSGAWFYKVASTKYTPPGWSGSISCAGYTYGVPPGFKGARGEGEIYYIYRNGSITTRNFTWEIYILNNPCMENGTARVIIRFQPTGFVVQRSVRVENLYGVIMAPIDIAAISGQPGAAVYGLGVSGAYQVNLQPRIVRGQIPGTYYYDFTTYYYNHDGMLVRVDSERILGAGNATIAPQYMRMIDRVTDFYSASGPGGEFVSYSKSADILTITSIVSGLYIVGGLLLIILGASKLFSTPG